jgi:glutathione synthase/RimK-type ligase-like ATP-grasp enzyme
VSTGLTREAILILTQPNDPTAQVVIDRLRDRELPLVCLDTATFPHRTQVTMRWRDGAPAGILHTETEDIDLSTLRSIWYRRPAEFQFSPSMTPDSRAFAMAEARQGFSGSLLTSSAIWMNRPDAESVALLKLVQLDVASRRGMLIPETLVTNRPEEAQAFLGSEGPGEETIFKRLSSMLLWTDSGELTGFQTEKVDEAARERIEHVSVTPCLFQRYIPKEYEIRATVVGGRVFAARVNSQQSATGAVDWRLDESLAWEPYTLPAEIEQGVLDVVRDLGLLFGAVDLIRRTDGEYVFLEVNPSGQWAWFQDEITHVIRDAIVDLLATSAGRLPAPTR